MKIFLGVAVLICALAVTSAFPQPPSDKAILKALLANADVPSRKALVQAWVQGIVEANQYGDNADVNQYDDAEVMQDDDADAQFFWRLFGKK